MLNVFVDGSTGTTAIQILSLLRKSKNVNLIELKEKYRDEKARTEALNDCDVAILCLPDDTSVDAVGKIKNENVKVIDTSCAFRTHPEWTYGFEELAPEARTHIESSTRVSNPGCFAIGAISVLRPLTVNGVIGPWTNLKILGTSGYTGGGKSMVAEFEDPTNNNYMKHPFFLYALDGNHKHIDEIVKYPDLRKSPIFIPSVGRFSQGMFVTIPIHGSQIKDKFHFADVKKIFEGHYRNYPSFEVSAGAYTGYDRLTVNQMVGTNKINIVLSKHNDGMVISAIFDNLGKGASRNVLQNLAIMSKENIGTPEV